MKTKVNSICNYIELPFEPVRELVTAAELDDEIQNEIDKELLSHRSYAAVETAAEGDVAELRLESDNNRYQKDSIKLNLGLGLFNRTLECSVTGRKAGESYTTEIDGDAVKVTILSVQRKVSAELSDAFVSELHIDGVSTVEEYREHLKEKYISMFREAYIEYHAMDLFDEMMGNSDIEYCEEDIALFLEQFAGGEDDPGDMEAAEEDARFVLNLYLTDCIARGIDYRKNEELPAGSKMTNALRDRVIAPIMRYLSDKIELVISEEEE